MSNERVTRILAAIPQPIMGRDEMTDGVTDGEIVALQIPSLTEEERLDLLAELLTIVVRYYGLTQGEEDITEEEHRLLRPIFTALILGIQAGQTMRDMSMAGTL